MVGNIATGKGQLEILKAFHLLSKNYPNIKLVFVGAGDTSTLKTFIYDNQLQSLVSITGFQENTELYYLKTDILIANSAREAFGRVLIEASSYAIPVIARSTGASTEIIIAQETGILHDGSIESIYQALHNLLHDNKLRSRLGEAGWKRCSELYNFEYSFQQFESVVNQLYIDAKH
ncbi:glycosyltransferase family 4 protein [Pedobacter aquae]|uniref:Glycosyltransferase family 4 protein n=1 Tax=Pedobacter aquae TaxID=2605747 RepID=A0A5C0VES0_9SPHI|nr:glycosyltransferase [Pedobacter aquae]QEK50332.1 glycosyltransferase family 4 protein [Pedobacter aquae]